mmetsp:Transcript_18739/g.27655  ORF Transcript_18739/g.27655 Transcript_18739/m.27655 type:complete len:352 (+) Transcript_18739:125-1180(+)
MKAALLALHLCCLLSVLSFAPVLRPNASVHRRGVAMKVGINDFMFKKTYTSDNLSGDFLSYLRSNELLSPSDEVRLGTLVQDFQKLVEKREDLAEDLGRVPSVEECADDIGIDIGAYNDVLEKGEWAKKAMVACNLRLVVSMAANFKGKGVPLHDLIQDGSKGLERAVEKFDPNLGFRFSTYATWWIRQRLILAVQKNRLVHIPIGIQNQYSDLRKTVRILAGELGRRPTEDELSERMDISVEKIKELTILVAPPKSLDREVQVSPNSSTDQSVVSFLELSVNPILNEENKISTLNSERSVEWNLMRDDLENCMTATLSKRERDILAMRVGLEDGKAKSAVEVSKVFQVNC